MSDESRDRAVQILTEHLFDKDKETSTVCTSAYTRYLADCGDYPEVDKLMAHRSKHVRTGVMKGLSKIIQSADDAIERTRKQNAGIPVQSIDFPPLCERLAKGLKDDSRDVQRIAAAALQHAASKKGLDIAEAAPALVEILSCGHAGTLQDAISALRASMWGLDSKTIETAKGALAALLDDKNKHVRQEAADAVRMAGHILEKRENA